MNQPFQHVAIIGCGLLGASLGLALRQANLAQTITGVGRAGSPSAAIARQRGAIDRLTGDVALAVAGKALPGEQSALAPADLVVLCTPVGQFPEMFRRMAPALAPGTLVTDVGSTKEQVMRWAAECLPAHAPFIGSHPMAGSEKSGPEAARAHLYQGAVCLVCKPPEAPAAAFERICALWQALGMRLIPCEPAQHDQWVAAVSHLPHLLAACLVNTTSGNPQALEAAAGGYIDTSRLASGDPTMWTDILQTNPKAISAIIGQFQARLAAMKDAVERGDAGAARALLESAKASRDAFIARRRQTPPAVKEREA